MAEDLLKPAEAAQRLGMPPSTLRVYSTRFADLLSESASNPPAFPNGKPGHRLYTQRDLVVLGKAKELVDQGLTYEQSLEEMKAAGLGLRPRPRATTHPASEPTAPSGSGVSADLLGKAVESWRALAEERGRENALLRQRVESLEKNLAQEVAELRERVHNLEDWARSRADAKGRFGTLFSR